MNFQSSKTNFAWKPEACICLCGVYLIWYFGDRSVNKPELIRPLVKNTTTFFFSCWCCIAVAVAVINKGILV